MFQNDLHCLVVLFGVDVVEISQYVCLQSKRWFLSVMCLNVTQFAQDLNSGPVRKQILGNKTSKKGN